VRLAGHEGIGHVSTRDHGPVDVVHGNHRRYGGHAVFAGGGHGDALHHAHVRRAVLVNVHHHARFDVPGVALVHADLHHHLGGVGDGDALAALDLRPLGEAAGEHRARDGGGGVILAQLVVGRLQLFLCGL